MCGEKRHFCRPLVSCTGSPPHVRGKVNVAVFVNNITRITPACAGKSQRIQILRIIEKDHPRVCGEKRIILCASVGVSGSPPRMRGKGTGIVFNLTVFRITPACAGKSRDRSEEYAGSWDHPRMCGEKRF